MLPQYMNRQGALTGTVFKEDGTSGTFFWSQETALEEISSLGGDEMSPTAINDAGTIIGFGTTANGETHGFVWSKANGLVDIGTLGGDFSWALGSIRPAWLPATARRRVVTSTPLPGPRTAAWSTWAR